MKHFSLQSPQSRFRNFDNPAPSVPFFDHFVRVVMKRRPRILSRHVPAISKPVQFFRLDFQPRGQITERRNCGSTTSCNQGGAAR
jgi:hypothetical protein